MGLSYLINTLLDFTITYISAPLVFSLLIGTGIFYTVYLGFPQISYFKRSFGLLLGSEKSTSEEGDTSVFQALATSLASSIGAGSIAGVGMAIHIGGPASIFWMWIYGILGMALRMTETVASHRYREKSASGDMVGGPMYFMKKNLKKPALGYIFALGAMLAPFTAGNLPQVNGMVKMLHQQWGIEKIWGGLAITCLVGVVIIGGIQRIGQVTELLVPIMALLYLALVTFIVIRSYDQILPSLYLMFGQPFRTAPVIGGFLGSSLMTVMNTGISYGFFTSDAGTGTAPIVHCASKEKNSGRVAIMSMVEPMISTCLMCTLTALAIVTTGSFQTKVINRFDTVDIQVLAGNYQNKKDTLHNHAVGTEKCPLFQGEITVQKGHIQNQNMTLLHNSSVAEDIMVMDKNKPFTGKITVTNGRIMNLGYHTHIQGRSLIKGASLSLYTFGNNPWGSWTSFLLIICFLLFAFSTIISFSYFGDRSLVYLGGEKYLKVYKAFFVACVFIGSMLEATIIWKVAVVANTMMALPNIISLLLRPKEIKQWIREGV